MKKYARVIAVILTGMGIIMGAHSAAFALASDAKAAAAHYRQGDYTQAKRIYQQLHETYSYNPLILYNLANTYYRLDEKGKAIGYYLKALKYAPRDARIHYNLFLTRRHLMEEPNGLQTPSGSESGVAFLLHRLSFYEYGVVFLCLFSLFNMMFVGYLIHGDRRLVRQGFIWMAVLMLVWGGVTAYKGIADFYIQRGVIVADQQAVKSAPSSSFDTLFYAAEGREFYIRKIMGKWVKVKFSDGAEGWISNGSFITI